MPGVWGLNMAGNNALNKASKAKNDEFYTQLSDIENELKHYKEYFKDKIVFCNEENQTSGQKERRDKKCRRVHFSGIELLRMMFVMLCGKKFNYS